MSESKKINMFVDQIIKKPKTYLVAGLLFLAFVGFGMSMLKPNFSYRIWFEETNPKLKEFDAFERRFGSDELAVIIVHSPSGIFDMDSAQIMTDLTRDMWKAPEVIRVDSLTNFNWVHGEGDDIVVEPLIPDDIPLTQQILDERKEIALHHPTINGYLVNNKADTGIIFARLKPSLEGTPNYELVVEGIRQILKKYEGKSDHTFYLTGNPVLNHAFKESAVLDMEKLVPLVFLMTVIFLIGSLRRINSVLLTLLIIFLTIVGSMGSGGWFGIELNNLTIIVPQFMIAIAIAVAVHILVSFNQFYARGIEKVEAIKLSALKNLRPTILTAVSTAIGFYSFATSPIPPISNMGTIAGTGTLFSWLLSYVILIPLVVLLPIRKFKGKKTTSREEVLQSTPLSQSIAHNLNKYRFHIISFAAIVSIISVYLAFQVEVNSDPFKYFNEKYPMTIATNFVEKNVGGATGVEIVLDAGVEEGIKDPAFLKKAEAFQKWVGEFPFVTKTVSVVDILKDMNKTLGGGSQEQYKLADSRPFIAEQLFLYTMNLPQGMDINDRVSLKNDAIRLTAMWTLHESKKVLDVIDQMEKKAKEMGLNARVTGKIPLYQSNNELIVNSFIISITLAVGLVGLLLIFGLQSLKFGLISMLPNAVPLLVGAGMLKILRQPLDIGTVIVGSVCMGIAVDDTIHFLANFKKYVLEGHSAEEAVSLVYTNTVPALITTTLVLIAAFATFILGSFVPNQNFGLFVAIILGVALIIDLTFLPALLLTFKTWGSQNVADKESARSHRSTKAAHP